jgi:hypothetical protein
MVLVDLDSFDECPDELTPVVPVEIFESSADFFGKIADPTRQCLKLHGCG